MLRRALDKQSSKAREIDTRTESVAALEAQYRSIHAVLSAVTTQLDAIRVEAATGSGKNLVHSEPNSWSRGSYRGGGNAEAASGRPECAFC
eukprot:3314045-Pyramimonas_sp.AAC.1